MRFRDTADGQSSDRPDEIDSKRTGLAAPRDVCNAVVVWATPLTSGRG